MADDVACFDGDERNRQRARRPQRVDDLGFGLIAVGYALEGRLCQTAYGGRVRGTLECDLHLKSLSKNHDVQPPGALRSAQFRTALLLAVSKVRDDQRVCTISDMPLA